MELNFTELDNINTKNSFDFNSYNQDNYWENKRTQEIDTKKKKVSFNDILSNMNLVVNKEGLLQFMIPVKNETNNNQNQYNQTLHNQNQYNQTQYNQNQYNQTQYNQTQHNQNQYNQTQHNQNQYNPYKYNPNEFSNNNDKIPKNFKQQNKIQKPIQSQQIKKIDEPLHPNLKHSYIYNKYFKNYVSNSSEKEGPRLPKTIEEYKRMLLEDKIKAVKHKKMIEQIKSKKLMFTTNPTMSINPKNIQATKNTLRMMNFR
jgi:hypothetical protein